MTNTTPKLRASQINRRQAVQWATALGLGAEWGGALAQGRGAPADDLPAPWAAALGQRLDDMVARREVHNLHAVLVLQHGKLAVSRYFEGTDELWGRPLGKVAFSAETLHDVRSISKSVVGLLYGLALADGLVPALDSPVLQAFAELDDLAKDERRQRLRWSHVLSMTMGQEWNEDLPYSDPRNSEIAMERSADRYRYVLERPMVAEPGAQWRYSGGATALLGHMLARGTGKPLLAYAQERLLGPLGITQAAWTPGTNGEAAAASGLRLRAPDLARLGQLVLDQGLWQGRRVVPADWLDASLQARVPAWEGLHYGYHWFVVPQARGLPNRMALGWGGQRLVVMPAQGVVYVILMGNYRHPEQLRQVFAVQKAIHAALA